MKAIALTTLALVSREVRIFYRARSRVVGAFLQPFVFWVLIGSGFNASLNLAGAEGLKYSDYFFPGILLMVILFTAIFSTITVIDDRKQGFLKGVLASPAPRIGIVLGKVGGGTLLGTLQGLLFAALICTPLVGLELRGDGLVRLTVGMAGLAAGLTALGLLIAWQFDSIQGYHAIMSVALFPMWIFSGAVFPVAGTPAWMAVVMKVNPLTYGLVIIRDAFEWPDGVVVEAAGPAPWCWLAVFGVVAVVVATVRISGDGE